MRCSKPYQQERYDELLATKQLVLQGKQASKVFYHSLLNHVSKQLAKYILARTCRFPLFNERLLFARYDSHDVIEEVVGSFTVEKFHECTFDKLKDLDQKTIDDLRKQAQAVILHVIYSDFYQVLKFVRDDEFCA